MHPVLLIYFGGSLLAMLLGIILYEYKWKFSELVPCLIIAGILSWVFVVTSFIDILKCRV